ncbi:Dolichyl-phosphate-mannose-protein mannosyltransferase-domain-containing protein [Umbelopsis sp. PMI_123]|nr:Dolichyl-phosphate-mannose-protein mannosyltransferase-domain-containing protein [Umbelopsis sp. PMI_123]
MLVGLSGLLAGYDGTFKFESGHKYPETLNYTFMRIFNASWGAAIVPIAYFTGKQLGFSERASILAAVMCLCDTAYLCISRFILLDSMLLFFTATTMLTLATFHNQRNQPFSSDWWLWLAFTGASLGLVSSVKWVGLFAVALVGIYTIEDLWEILGDLQMPKMTYIKHFMARAACLIVLPMCIYMLSFKLHFAILTRSGPGDAQMSSLFQAGLQGSTLGSNPVDLVYGSKFTLKNFGYGGGLLHSHVQRYPSGSEQQQITCYHHKDSNNDWIITKKRENGVVPSHEDDVLERVKDGDIVRLVHAMTKTQLHSHAIKAPITSSQWEVSGYGDHSIGDDNDHWKVEIVKDFQHNDATHVRALTTLIRLRHTQLGCLLSANNVNLPQWGFKQIEVVCDKRNETDNPHMWWNVENHENDKLPTPEPNTYKSSFLDDFRHLNVAMWTSNNALVPDPDKEDILSSEPTEWPFTAVGLRMCGWGDNEVKFYLIGNPIVWWSAMLAIIGSLVAFATYVIRMHRQIRDLAPAEWSQFYYVTKTLVLGWVLHYMPFFIMGRVTYLHHYFPALYFGILLVPFMIDHLTSKLNQKTQLIIWAAAYISVIFVFLHFAPMAYGMTGPASNYSSRKWRKSWNLY